MKKLAQGALAAAVAAGSLALVPTVAQAAAGNCHADIVGKSVVGTCDTGDSQFRIKADCPFQPDQHSPWQYPGRGTAVTCNLTPRGFVFEFV